ncbi:SDR family oxidoreductase [Terrimonas sp. NA20]|uniref:SDR family oxidoreductase n=1 Tax=Terrimonas ginsenosidimutans TaxID=2908004 RepID=A0ABS9KYZ1_9BACT|nr:SDR family oxidoreductase [Terrimonas ginsenosidimutans]MCG2617609.1 SDR family oxidoreductase [Terrimonas ginsenosidimutans]
MKVLITGASRGIGKAIANVFAKQGHQLFLSSRNEQALERTADQIAAEYPQATVHCKAFDLSRKEDALALAEWMEQSAGAPDILVNNAGSFEPGSVHNEADGVLERQLSINLFSAYHLTRALLPLMMKNGQGRHIFNMCSIASLKAYDNGGAYSISKFALYGFSKNLREEMKPHGIKVTAVMPGATLTDSWEGYDNSSRRIMEAKDIAMMVYASSQLSVQACVEDIVIRPQLGDL